VEDYFLPFFSPVRDASAEKRVMDAPFNNNLSSPFNDVMDNPENPDSKPVAAARKISIDDLVLLNLSFCRCVACFEPIY
jgi:hypothetical protein